MASKSTKRPAAKAAAKPAAKASPKAKAPLSTASSVIPFSPLAMNVGAKGAGQPFGNFESMEQMMNTSKNQYEKITADATNSSRQSVEAYMKSSTVMMKGIEQIMKTCMTLAQESADRNSESVKTLMACKTVNELMEAQNKLAQQNFDDIMSAATKLSEISIKVSNEVLEPINEQVTKSMKKASETMAA
jgi:phasin family protein